ncbi:thiopeptide-type bacteriocin [Micromonospora sp. LOL_024]|uniref:thiopeptide-type bacteriocin n=1 Tax=Micromonospora sp. LOL_024 TaxID=3345412 RepID=UPI003A8BB60B
MPQNDTELINLDDEFSLADLDLSELTVVNMHDSAALPESGASYTSSSSCYVATK